uniref:Uncharacterized protein n=1 Tax=Arundo donax TaxID=35708 RepID=A0A0A9CH80_ARUDO
MNSLFDIFSDHELSSLPVFREFCKALLYASGLN